MNATETYIHDRDEQVRKNLEDRDLRVYAERFTAELVRTNYTKNFTYMGVPILQYPADLMVMQELIWKIRPRYFIETGTAMGGSAIFYASILHFIGGNHDIITIDVDIRVLTAERIKSHYAAGSIHMVEGDSASIKTLEKVKKITVFPNVPTIVVLDSLHTHSHVLQELRLYSPLVSMGSYIVVFDTAIEQFGYLDKNQDRPWGPGNNPWGAVQEFMQENDEFVVDKEVEQRAGITAAPGGWLRRIK